MPTVFTKIINGDLPGRFVWRDERCVAFLSIHPLRPGHVLVVPRREVEHWVDLDPSLMQHLMSAAHAIGKALELGFKPAKVGLMIAGLEVPHVHIHLLPIQSVRDLDFANQDPSPDPRDLDRAAETMRAALRQLGYEQVAE